MITPYTAEYKDDAMRLARMMHQESRFAKFDFSDQKIDKLLENPNIYKSLSIVDGAVVGFFAGVVTQMWFSEAKNGVDLALYVFPQARGGMSGVRLIKDFERYCKSQGAVTMSIGSSAEINTNAAKRIYSCLGFVECGFLAHKDI